MAPISIAAADLLTAASCREFILLAGKDGVGKTSALISLAEFVAGMWPEATVFVLDTENKFRVTLQSYGSVPPNLVYYKVDNMNEITEAFDEIMKARKPGDWLFVESMGRVWERAQDLGYQAIVGTAKAAYMEKRRATPTGGKMPPVTPKPDDLWSVIKGAHDSAFLDIISATDDLNVVRSTTTQKAKPERTNRQESPDRKAFKVEFGLDLGLDGAPRLPTYVHTMLLLDREGGNVGCRVLRDNGSRLLDPRVSFDVPNRKSFAESFWVETGR
jgi:hypothetical protein